eukprot:365940-Chlamydomonas_euryale.AAC.29
MTFALGPRRGGVRIEDADGAVQRLLTRTFGAMDASPKCGRRRRPSMWTEGRPPAMPCPTGGTSRS